MIKNIVLLYIIVNSFTFYSQDWANQRLAIIELNDNFRYGYFGSNEIKDPSGKINVDRNSKELFLKAAYTLKRLRKNGRTYKDIKFKVQLKMKNVHYIYEEGNKLYFEMKFKGYLANVKVPGENWTGYIKNTNDWSLTIYDSEKRKKALKYFKTLVKFPILLKE